ncbi:hypothetical protein BCV70DRAFT_109770 [Testicularia cyperi]|uniref:Uncharacterized protein n=1 Tax=Testicularia cyperi TaxID=1882483 RepID=A0A317XHU7_9BASI|nr:hypothetical protein BCV70DRAFT_109770 [Testicularia cyperi]
MARSTTLSRDDTRSLIVLPPQLFHFLFVQQRSMLHLKLYLDTRACAYESCARFEDHVSIVGALCALATRLYAPQYRRLNSFVPPTHSPCLCVLQ